MNFIKQIPLELIIWIIALLFLYFIDIGNENHSICPLHNMGFEWCPGCGLGRAIHLLMHGQINDSLEMHIMGIPVLLVLIYRIVQLARNYITYTLNT